MLQHHGLRLLPTSADPDDSRVAMTMQVLQGASPADVARQWGAEEELLERWVSAFVDGGIAAVTNRPQQQAAQERDRFLTAFAHELRTPLAAVRGWADLLVGGDVSPSVRDTGLAGMRRAIDRLVDRLVDVELLAAASLGRMPVTTQRCRLADLTTALPVGVEVSAGDGAEHLMVDPALFTRVIRDLFQAASLPPVPRRLRLQTMTDGAWTELRVVRDADPIDHALLTALFEPFGAENVNNDGTGITLGLYLARALVVAHGGTIGLEQDDHQLILWVRVPQAPDSGTNTPPAKMALAGTRGEDS